MTGITTHFSDVTDQGEGASGTSAPMTIRDPTFQPGMLRSTADVTSELRFLAPSGVVTVRLHWRARSNSALVLTSVFGRPSGFLTSLAAQRTVRPENSAYRVTEERDSDERTPGEPG